MSAVATPADAPVAVSRRPGANPWFIAVLVAVATFMEMLDTTIVNVSLRYIAGGLGVSEDEASWAVTTYLVANATILTASAFLAKTLGRKAFFVICLMLFTANSVLCGVAWNLPSLVLFRIMQGFSGGGMVPVASSILVDAFPPEKRSRAFALFGVAVAVGPAVGPTLGGWLSDNVSWHWCFLINGPIGLITTALFALLVRPSDAGEERLQGQRQKDRFDGVGFVLVATFLGALEIVLDRGLEDDWFNSSLITTAAFVCASAFMLMIPWEVTRRNPMIDVRMLATRQFGTCFVMMLATGALLLATTQFLPELTQEDFGYTATWAGVMIFPGGVVAMIGMFVAGRMVAKIQPKYLIAAGAVIIALSMYALTNVYGDLGFWFMARCRMMFAFGICLMFIPITAASYDGIPPAKTGQASALINAARNTGGSIGISLVSNVLWRREQFHQSRLVDQALPSSVQYQNTLHFVTNYFAAQGSPQIEARQQAAVWVGQQVQTQASFLAYMDAFWVLTLLALAAVPLALTLRAVKLKSAKPTAH